MTHALDALGVAREKGVSAYPGDGANRWPAAHFVARDLAASSAWTRATLGWTPIGPGMIDDLDNLSL